MERSDIRVTDEGLRVAAEYLWLEMWNHSGRTIATGAADHCLHARVEPDSHEVLGATFVFRALESTHRGDLAVEHDAVPSSFERANATVQPAFAWCV